MKLLLLLALLTLPIVFFVPLGSIYAWIPMVFVYLALVIILIESIID